MVLVKRNQLIKTNVLFHYRARLFNKKRPFFCIDDKTQEAEGLCKNTRNGLGQAIIQGFNQVAKNKEVREYFVRGREIAKKDLETLGSILDQNYLSRGAFNLTGEVTDSKAAPFSDKLMMYHIAALSTSAVGQYRIAMSSSPRHDLGLMYACLSAKIYKYTNDGTNIMIDHGWVEQPPEATNRKNLSQ